MDASVRKIQNRKRAFGAFSLAAFSCLLGLSFCLIKSPQARSEAYLAAAIQALDENHPQEAAAAALQAVTLNPSAPKGWHMLSQMLQQKGDTRAAQQARVIASRLQQNGSDSALLYAMPAELKLSLLALSDTDIR